jgi:hypothetical protein
MSSRAKKEDGWASNLDTLIHVLSVSTRANNNPKRDIRVYPHCFSITIILFIVDRLRQFGTELSVNRVANGEFTPEARGFICGAAMAGESHQRIADAVGAKDSSTVTRIIKRVSTRKTGVTANRRRGKYKTSPRDERHLVVLARKHPEATYWDLIRRAGLNIHPQTCKKILQRHYLRNWRKAKRTLLMEEDAHRRLEFAREWSQPAKLEQLKRALFSDVYESEFSG